MGPASSTAGNGAGRSLADLAKRYPRSKWPLLVAVVRPEGLTLQPRADLAAFFARNDLPELAREAIARRVGPGEVLVWAEVDLPEIAYSGFQVAKVGGR